MDWMAFLKEFGFPVFACGAMGWYIYTMTNKFNTTVQELNAAFTKTIDRITVQHKAEVDSLSTVIENNTLAITVLNERLGNEHPGKE